MYMFFFLMFNGKKLIKFLNNRDLVMNFIKCIFNFNFILVFFLIILICDKIKENYINWVNKNVGYCNLF